jgi:hypothetical protein
MQIINTSQNKMLQVLSRGCPLILGNLVLFARIGTKAQAKEFLFSEIFFLFHSSSSPGKISQLGNRPGTFQKIHGKGILSLFGIISKNIVGILSPK